MGALGGSRKLLVAGERDVIITDPNLTSFATVTNPVDVNQTTVNRLATGALQWIWNSTAFTLEGKRTVRQGRALTGATADGTAIWTPGVGLRGRVLGYAITVSSQAIKGVAGPLLVGFTDNGANWFTGAGSRLPLHACFVPAAAGPIGPPLMDVCVVYPDNGLLQSATNTSIALLVTNGPLTGGTIDLWLWGTEE
jgi:hypothetical protein